MNQQLKTFYNNLHNIGEISLRRRAVEEKPIYFAGPIAYGNLKLVATLHRQQRIRIHASICSLLYQYCLNIFKPKDYRNLGRNISSICVVLP